MTERKWLRYENNKAHSFWLNPFGMYAMPLCRGDYYGLSVLREDPDAPRCRRCEAKLKKEGKHDTR